MMANQFNMEVALNMKAGQSTTIGLPNGQQVTVSGEGQMKLALTSGDVNVIPFEDEEDFAEEINGPVADEYDDEDEDEEIAGPVADVREWPDAQPGSFFYKIDTITNAGKQLSKDFTNSELEDFISLKMMNANTFKLIFARMNLSAQVTKNIQARIRKLVNPELRKEANRKSIERYHRLKRESRAAMA
jgi:hypothetical protein